MHTESHPLAGKTVTAVMKGTKGGPQTVEYRLEDWWDLLTGGSWMFAEGNPAALNYAMRSGFSALPVDDEVVYGKVGNLGHLIHVSEIVTEVPA